MNFTRGIEPKIAMNTGLRALEIVFLGYNENQPHNRSMIERVLNDIRNPEWDNLQIYFEKTENHPSVSSKHDIRTYKGGRNLYYCTIGEIKTELKLNCIKFNDTFFCFK